MHISPNQETYGQENKLKSSISYCIKKRTTNPIDIPQIILRQLHSVLETFAGSGQPRLHYFVSSAKASGVRLSDATKPLLLADGLIF